jgi:hypothetical protein
MSATPEQKAAGCFGAASVYSTDSTVCQACPAFAACGVKALETLESIRDFVDVRDLLKKHAAARLKVQQRLSPPGLAKPLEPSPIRVAQPAPVTEPIERKTASAKVDLPISDADQAVIQSLSKSVKAKEAAVSLCKAGKVDEMRAGLPLQRNPFATEGPKYLRVACDMLMRGGFTKASLRHKMIEQLGWTNDTAASHVAVGVALLYAFGIAIPDTSGAFTMNPALYDQN